MLHNPYCSPSTSRAAKTSGVNYIPPGLVSSVKNPKDTLNSEGHTVIDLGQDEFTVGRPHPMIDYSLLPEILSRAEYS